MDPSRLSSAFSIRWYTCTSKSLLDWTGNESGPIVADIKTEFKKSLPGNAQEQTYRERDSEQILPRRLIRV
eukprot:3263325-Rhodomonas_salina.4